MKIKIQKIIELTAAGITLHSGDTKKTRAEFCEPKLWERSHSLIRRHREPQMRERMRRPRRR